MPKLISLVSLTGALQLPHPDGEISETSRRKRKRTRKKSFIISPLDGAMVRSLRCGRK